MDGNKKPDDQTLDLLKYNYDNLHKSVWEAHKISWTMTGIYVPVIATGIGYLATIFGKMQKIEVFIAAAMTAAVAWFWYGMIHILAVYNLARFKKLEEIEDVFTQKYYATTISGHSFEQYGRHKKQFLSFRKLALIFTLFLTAILLSAVIMKMGECPA